MNPRHITLAAAVLALVLHCAPSDAADVWYQDNNLGGRGDKIPPDFEAKFHRPESFAQATKLIDVYMIRAPTLQELSDTFLTTAFFPYLEKNNIKLAINTGAATWAKGNARRRRVFDEDIEMLRRLKRLGGRVDFISLQSVLSKPWRRGKGGDVIEFPMDRRVAGAVEYAVAARAVYPDVAIGIIDALLSKGMEYKDPYRQLVDALGREGIKLSYIHLDVPFATLEGSRNGVTWARTRELEAYVENDLGTQFGLFVQSRKAGNTSSAAFYKDVMAMLECYAGSGGTPRDYIVTSWYRYPDRTIPETATGDDFPAMRIVLDFGRKLDKIEKAGAVWIEEQHADRDWRRQCGLASRH